MEYLTFNQGGQWSLHKARSKDDDYLSYKNMNIAGQLREDHDRKGWLHNVGNNRAPRQSSDNKMKAKVPNPMASAVVERNPGLEGVH